MLGEGMLAGDLHRLGASGKRVADPHTGILKQSPCSLDYRSYMENFHGDSAVDCIDGFFKNLGIEVIIRNHENLPHGGRNIFVANHPYSRIDMLALLDMLLKKYERDVKIFMNHEFTDDVIFRPYYLPVVRGILQPGEVFDGMEKTLRGDYQIGIFPSGQNSIQTIWGLRDPCWKSSFVRMAGKYCRDIVPVHITAHSSFPAYLYNKCNDYLYGRFKSLFRDEQQKKIKEALLHSGFFRLLMGINHNIQTMGNFNKAWPLEITVGHVIPYAEIEGRYGAVSSLAAQKIKKGVYSLYRDS